MSRLDKWPIFGLLDDDILRSVRLACVFGPSGNEALFITYDDEVYSFGTNASGCLGVGDSLSSLTARKIDILSKKQVVKLSFGSGPHVLALTAQGNVYSWGHNGYCQLGNGCTTQSLSPTLITTNLDTKKVTDVACGSHHSLVLTSDGEVYAWGQNNCGQIGSGTTSNQTSPRKVTSCIGTRITVSITCGQSSSMVALDSGELFGWGYNGNGQIGLGNTANQINPYRVSALNGHVISKIAMGYAHTVALSDEGHMFAWGANSYGQLASGDRTQSSTPVRITCDERVVDIAAIHYNHLSACQLDMGSILMWGQCKGQTVMVPTNTKCSTLVEVFSDFAIPAVTPYFLEFENPGTSHSVVDSLAKSFDDSNSADIKFKVDGKLIHVHKAILKIRCSYFASMFQGHWNENAQDIIEMKDYSYPVFNAFLYYLYTGMVNVKPEEAIGLLDLANAYCEDHLKKECQLIIRNGIDVDNAAMLYAAAVKYEAQDLEDFCFRFALNHMTDIIRTDAFNKLDEHMVKNFIRKAADNGAFKH